jgi:hypothetical protein
MQKPTLVRVASVGTDDEDNGLPIHRQTRAVLDAHGIPYARSKRATLVSHDDLEQSQYVLAMTQQHLADLRRFHPSPPGEVGLQKLRPKAGERAAAVLERADAILAQHQVAGLIQVTVQETAITQRHSGKRGHPASRYNRPGPTVRTVTSLLSLDTEQKIVYYFPIIFMSYCHHFNG